MNKELIVNISMYMLPPDLFNWLSSSREIYGMREYILRVRFNTADVYSIYRTLTAYSEYIREFRRLKHLKRRARVQRSDETPILLFC